MNFLLWFLGIPAGLLVVLAITWSLEWVTWRLGLLTDDCREHLNGWQDSTRQQRARAQDHKDFLNWITLRLGNQSLGRRVDEHLVDAQRQGETIRPLIENEIPKAVLQCVESHRLLAEVSGAFHMAEIALEPECRMSRALVTWLLSHTVELLDAYPLRFEDPRLMHNAVVLRKRALPTCLRCPFIRVSVASAPRLCPTGELVQIHGAPHDS